MTRQQKIFWAKIAVIVSVIPAVIFGYADGPDPGKSAVPSESSCVEAGCHVGTVNSGSGSVAVTFPGGQTYTPGARQHLVVTVSDPTMRRWGFQLTARTSGNAKTQAGTFKSTDNSTLLMCSNTNLTAQQESRNGTAQGCPASMTLQYIEHATAKNATGSATFEFDWTPPAGDVGNIVIYVAGNAANADGNNTGDRIYTRTYTLTPQAGSGGPKPVISSNAVTNGASFQPGIAAGSWVTIKGTNLAANTTNIDWSSSIGADGKLPTSLNNVSVTVNGKPAYVYFVRNDQVNVLAPADTSLGPVSVVVTNNGVASDPATAQLQTFSPAFFQYNGTWAVATTPAFQIVGDPARVAGTVAVKPGDVIILWGTGFGATDPAAADGQVVTGSRVVTTAPSVTIGGSAATYGGGALSPSAAGLYQIVVTVPNVSDGDQKVIATVGGVSSPDSVTIYVKR
jgi:uncharacterized protein (TIGR03437 family)